MPQRPEASEYTTFQASYVALVPEGDILSVLEAQVGAVQQLVAASAGQELHRYAPEKWSVRQVLGHLADAERIFGYRALCIARGQTEPLPPFDENLFVETGSFDRRPLAGLAEELLLLRRANLSMLQALSNEAWTRSCLANGMLTTTRAIAWIMAGHLRHHLGILKDRYGLAVE